MSYKAIIFDMDGTLLNTLTGIGKATNRVLAAMNFPQHPMANYRYLVGEGAARLIRCALPEDARDEQTIQQGLKAFQDDYRLNWQANTQPYDGIVDMLDALAEHGVRMAILSNKPHNITKACVEEMLADWKFEVVFGQRDDVPRKPDPFSALEIARMMEIQPSDYIFMGDTGIDMKTASNGGMFPLGVLWGFRPEKELREEGAKVLIKDPLEILDILSGE